MTHIDEQIKLAEADKEKALMKYRDFNKQTRKAGRELIAANNKLSELYKLKEANLL